MLCYDDVVCYVTCKMVMTMLTCCLSDTSVKSTTCGSWLEVISKDRYARPDLSVDIHLSHSYPRAFCVIHLFCCSLTIACWLRQLILTQEIQYIFPLWCRRVIARKNTWPILLHCSRKISPYWWTHSILFASRFVYRQLDRVLRGINSQRVWVSLQMSQ